MRRTALPTTPVRPRETNEATILSRLLLDGQGGLTPELARHILGLGFNDEDKARMHELAVKNQEGRITQEELRDLDSYLKAGDLLAILKLKARKRLKTTPK